MGGGGGGGDEPAPTIDEEWEKELVYLAQKLGWKDKGCGGDGKGSDPPPFEREPVPTPVVPPPVPNAPEPPSSSQKSEASRGQRRRGLGSGVPRYEKYWVASVPGGPIIGYILINEHSRSLDVHCLRHGNSCAISRSYVPWDEKDGKWTPLRLAKGRPLGFLVSWLRWGLKWNDGEAFRDAHYEASKCKGDAARLADGASIERASARRYVEVEPTLQPCRAMERTPRPDEGPEPKGKI